MSYASDQLLKDTVAKVVALEKLCAEFKEKIEALSAVMPIRSTISLRKPQDKQESRI